MNLGNLLRQLCKPFFTDGEPPLTEEQIKREISRRTRKKLLQHKITKCMERNYDKQKKMES